MKRITKIISSAAALGSIITMTPFTVSAEEVSTPITTSVISVEKTALESTLPISSEIETTTTTSEDSTIKPDNVEKVEAKEKSSLPQGNGILLEDTLDENVNRRFLSIQSKNGNTFYIVIDKDSEGRGNVYFMNLVDEYDLMAFADNFPDEDKDGSMKKVETTTDETGEVSTDVENVISASETTTESNNQMGTSKANLLVPSIGILALIGGAAFYFFKVNGASAQNNKENDFIEDDEDFDDGDTVNEDE